jgi:hypothetical protein
MRFRKSSFSTGVFSFIIYIIGTSILAVLKYKSICVKPIMLFI